MDSLSLSYIKDRKAVSHDVEQGYICAGIFYSSRRACAATELSVQRGTYRDKEDAGSDS